MRVGPSDASLRHRVIFNRRSLCASMLMTLNLVLMPLKAYITEPFPWTPARELADCGSNFTACAPTLLAFYQAAATPVSGAYYVASDVVDIYALELPTTLSPDAFEQKAPFHMLYSDAQRDYSRSISVANSTVNSNGSVARVMFASVPALYNAAWAVRGLNTTGAYFALQRAPSTTLWLCIKLAYRVALSGYILRCIWREYFVHYKHLASSLGASGLDVAPHGSRFEILVGDPTSIILLNHFVSLAFVIDVYMSPDYFVRSLQRVEQLENIPAFALASLYLSRTVWFAYGALSCFSCVVRKKHWQDAYEDVDPSLVALAVALTAGPLTYLQVQIPLVSAVYNLLFTVFESSAVAIELAWSFLLYTTIMGSLPIAFAVGTRWQRVCARRLRHVTSRVHSLADVCDHAAFATNDLKHRWTLRWSLFSWQAWCRRRDTPTVIEHVGGSVYKLFERSRKYKRELGISQRGADCYVLFETSENELTSVRLSLLATVDMSHLPVMTVAKYAVGRIEFRSDGTAVVVQGRNASPWVM
ncbi:hypothetical protein SDRG_16300 [Saprolegnia diclina VS20]|uniref:Transmembrane protein n=1 Tax=Saprolegnia diclina (strain VS20) TaxID=1156394 RepID=T0PUE3_SAPDV|nr:hypothetical protein SDRG_16300 [Saprolegnia diclina VS20]EQC25851.1 hypothetical protein SDRG_16300 [Saprolegnia diclina VS20]|eukprot:XP_008620726.1 hypothetical protein SDRG_16300 [Saprolegnia diclina VS20]